MSPTSMGIVKSRIKDMLLSGVKTKAVKIMLLVFASFFYSFQLFAQTTVSGKVIDEDNQGVAYANVYIKNSTIGSMSNIQGEFAFSVPIKSDNDTLVVSCIGYEGKYIPLSDYSVDEAILLKKEVKVFDVVSVEGKQSDPKKLLAKASENVDANFPDSAYNASVFSRQFIKYDTAFVFYRKTLAEIESRNDNIWFGEGEISADQIINSGKLPYDSKAFGESLYRILAPAIDFGRHFPKLNKYEAKIDTVYYAENDIIYVVDIWAKKMKSGTFALSQTILDGMPHPYSMIFNPGVEKLGVKMAEDKSYLMRYYINTSKQNTVIRKKEMFVSRRPGKTFNYIISDFKNEAGNSYPTHVVSYVMNINKETNGSRGNIISLNEIFCYDYKNPALKKFTPENSLYKQYTKPVLELLRENLQDYNTWKEQRSFVLTDSLQEKAVRQVEMLKQFP